MSVSGRSISRTLSLTFKVAGLAESNNGLNQLASKLNLIVRLYISARIAYLAYQAVQNAGGFMSLTMATTPWGILLLAGLSIGSLAYTMIDQSRTS